MNVRKLCYCNKTCKLNSGRCSSTRPLIIMSLVYMPFKRPQVPGLASSLEKLFFCPRRMCAVVQHVLKLVPVLGRCLQAVDGRHIRVQSHLERRRQRRVTVAQSVADDRRGWYARVTRLRPRDESSHVVLDGRCEGDLVAWWRGTLR